MLDYQAVIKSDTATSLLNVSIFEYIIGKRFFSCAMLELKKIFSAVFLKSDFKIFLGREKSFWKIFKRKKFFSCPVSELKIFSIAFGKIDLKNFEIADE